MYVFVVNVHIMWALDVDFDNDALRIIGFSRVIACGALSLDREIVGRYVTRWELVPSDQIVYIRRYGDETH